MSCFCLDCSITAVYHLRFTRIMRAIITITGIVFLRSFETVFVFIENGFANAENE